MKEKLTAEFLEEGCEEGRERQEAGDIQLGVP